jgi:hypothetical protein
MAIHGLLNAQQIAQKTSTIRLTPSSMCMRVAYPFGWVPEDEPSPTNRLTSIQSNLLCHSRRAMAAQHWYALTSYLHHCSNETKYRRTNTISKYDPKTVTGFVNFIQSALKQNKSHKLVSTLAGISLLLRTACSCSHNFLKCSLPIVLADSAACYYNRSNASNSSLCRRKDRS